MKTKKVRSIKQARAVATRKRAVQRRPMHKRVLLHPLSAFALLCVGVLVVGSTFRGQAATYDVTATVPAPAVTDPAVITEPSNGQHLSGQAIAVKGSCPPQSYVKLYRDGSFAGVSICNAGVFSVQSSLLAGANKLQARVFNLTDNEGPESSIITAYYDLPITITPQATVPTTLRVATVDEESYHQGSVEEVTNSPTISGYAPPFSNVTVTFYSEPSVCKTKANAQGLWSCTLASSLPPGLHHVEVMAVTQAGRRFVFPTFEIAVIKYAEPFVIASGYKYQAHQKGQAATWTMAIKGGTPPFELVTDWGDGSTSHIVRPDWSEFELSHTYDARALSDIDYNVVITATDARGATTILQVTTTIKGIAAPAVVTRTGFAAMSEMIRQWLWVVWPVYIAVVLMALSFWIGEREAYQRFLAKRRMGRPRPHAGRR